MMVHRIPSFSRTMMDSGWCSPAEGCPDISSQASKPSTAVTREAPAYAAYTKSAFYFFSWKFFVKLNCNYLFVYVESFFFLSRCLSLGSALFTFHLLCPYVAGFEVGYNTDHRNVHSGWRWLCWPCGRQWPVQAMIILMKVGAVFDRCTRREEGSEWDHI